MDKEKLSIIVPVYKVERYLDECIESLVNQSYKNIEIILVDDGSPDQSGAICDSWAHKDNRIYVIHKKNEGAAKARNEGLRIASGEYIGFVDGDDYISPYMFQTLIHLIHYYHCDIAECGFYKTDISHLELDKNIIDKPMIADSETALKYHIQDKLFKQTIWNKVYNKSVIVPFTEGKYIDDEFWVYQVLGKSKRLISVNAKMYAYRQQEQSVMHAGYSLKRLDALEAKKRRCDYISINFPSLDVEARNSLFFSCVYQYQMALKHLSGKDKKDAISIIKKYVRESRLKAENLRIVPWKQKIWGILLKISFGGTCWIRNLLHYGF